jgi:large subunit ribosomal protein L29
MATSLKAHELDELNDVDLEARLREAKEELFNLRFQAATGQLESHGRLRTVKKDIARIYTVVRERELGIRVAPGASNADTADTADTADNTEEA